MKIIKEVLIHGKRWRLEFKSFSDKLGKYGNSKFVLNLHCLDIKSKSVSMFNNWRYIYVYKDFHITPWIHNSMLEAKIDVLNYLLYENI